MKILFISTMSAAPWGGSEELWSQAAMALLEQNHEVCAIMEPWRDKVPQRTRLQDRGVRMLFLRWTFAARLRWLFARLRNKFFGKPHPEAGVEVWGDWIRQANPDLVCISDGCAIAGLGWAKACVALKLPFVTLAQANAVHWWPDDEKAAEVREIYGRARRMFFVSRGNRAMLETQTAWNIPHAEIIRNPFNVDYESSLAWPVEDDGWKLACVGRLEPVSKGQDLLLEVLGGGKWKDRKFGLTFFGRGANEKTLQRLAARQGLGDRVHFAGQTESVAAIWAEHHALVLPSRYEGLPLALVEAMLCGRIPIVTDAGGNAEVVQDGIDGFVARGASAHDLDEALERAWAKRAEWQEMGAEAAVNIRKLVPKDPAGEFAGRLLEIASERDNRD